MSFLLDGSLNCSDPTLENEPGNDAEPERVAIIKNILYTDFGTNIMLWLEKTATPHDLLKGKNKDANLERMLFASLIVHLNLWQSVGTVMESDPSKNLLAYGDAFSNFELDSSRTTVVYTQSEGGANQNSINRTGDRTFA